MELNLYSDSLRPERESYRNRFELKISDFLPEVQQIINTVHVFGGRVVYYESFPGSYVTITE